MLGSLEKTQLLLLQPEREEKGANTGESGEGGEEEGSFQEESPAGKSHVSLVN